MLVTAYEALKFLYLVLALWYHYSCVANNRCINIFFPWKLVFLTHWNLYNGLLCMIVSFPLIKATVYATSARSLPTPPAFAMINPVSETNFYAPYQQQMPIDEYPQGLGQPDCCYFLKTGDYKYKRNCRFNHPKLQSSKSTSCALSNKALPLRPVSHRTSKIMIQLTNSPLIMWCLKYILLN